MRPDRLGTIQHGGPRTLRSSTAKRLLIGLGVAFFILAVPIAITGSEDDRRTVLAVGAVAATIAGLWWLDRTFRAEPRRLSMQDEGRRLGLRMWPRDEIGVAAMPFDLLRPRMGVRDVTNVMSGRWRGIDVITFEYRWASEEREERYSCAVLEVPGVWPSLLVKHETPLTWLVQDAGIGDLRMEWEEFNQAFHVRTAEPRFATAVLDGRMMQWLMSLTPRCGFEIVDGRLLVPTAQVPPWELEGVLETALDVREHIPPVAWSLFGDSPPRPDAEPTEP